ncbi:MAG: DUF6769 family protein [Tannerellaceae bacterium]
MRVNLKKQIVQYLMLLSSILVLLTVVMPHHHHSNGMPCYQSLATEAEAADHTGSEGHDCDCSGHNPVFTSSFEFHATDGDAGFHLYPLLTLFDYMYPPEIAFHGQLFYRVRPVYIESLHDTWIAHAVGLRAPPRLI